jgi:hypothetical protein
MYPIVVPSLGRAGTATSMKWLKDVPHEVVLAVHEDEVRAYGLAYPWAAITILPEETRHHTGLIRKHLMKTARSPFHFVDDDIRLSLKAVLTPGEVFAVIEKHLASGASMAGIGQQLFSNMVMEKCREINGDKWAIDNKFVATVYGVNPTHFDDCPLERLPVYEDVALVIHAMQRGGCICSYVATHSNVSPAEGGCNAWRNEEVTIKSLITLTELYPEYCSIRDTKNTTHSQNIGIGLRTAWSKIKKLP